MLSQFDVILPWLTRFTATRAVQKAGSTGRKTQGLLGAARRAPG